MSFLDNVGLKVADSTTRKNSMIHCYTTFCSVKLFRDEKGKSSIVSAG